MTAARTKVPMAVWIIGFITLVPFFAAAAVYCYGPPNLAGPALLALLGFSTAILSYLGGVRGGLELAKRAPRWTVMGLSMLAPFVAFALLLGSAVFDAVWQLSGFLTAFLLQWAWDVRDTEGPIWRPRYRTIITFAGAIALSFALEQALRM